MVLCLSRWNLSLVTTAFAGAHYWSLLWARWIHCTLANPISLKSVLILSFHLCLCLPNDIFPSHFPAEMKCADAHFSLSAMCPVISPFFIWSPK
jgi:hypothetical protein